MVRELGSERRETVWSLSVISVSKTVSCVLEYERTGDSLTSGLSVVYF